MSREKKSILFLNPDSSYLVGFTGHLTEQGYVLKVPSGYKEAAQWVRRNEVQVMVFADSPRQESISICREVAKQFPRLPVIYIIGSDSPIEDEVVENAHRRIIRPLSQRKQLSSVLQDLLEIGKWMNVSTPLPSDQIFFDIELTAVVDTVLNFMDERFQVNNIVWMLPDELKRISEVKGQWQRIETIQRFGNPANLRSLRPTNESTLVKLLAAMNVPDDYVEQARSEVLVGGEDGACLIVPSFKPDGTSVNGYFYFEGLNTDALHRATVQMEEILLFMSQHITFSTSYYEAQEAAHCDNLTGLYNQQYLEKVIDAEIEISRDKGQKFSVLFIDVDHFKTVNDTNGHWVGSLLLKQMGHLMDNAVRARDYAFRYGGDEFVMVLPDTDKDQAELVAERIRRNIENHKFVVDGLELEITVSVGIAEFPSHAQTKKDLIEIADKAMYLGKNKSRNIVYVAS